MKHTSPFMEKLGASSTAAIHEQFERAMRDPETHAILLHVDSPGGTVDGTQALADHIYNSRGRGKPIHALVDGMGASAAYWIGSSAHKVFAHTPTAQIGSIGVRASHVDFSKALDNAGVTVTDVVSGPHKGLGASHKPLGAAGHAEMQAMVDGIHAEFAAHVAKARGLSKDALAKVSTGRVFLARDAIAHGLVDGIATYHGAIDQLRKEAVKGRPTPVTAKAPPLAVGDVALHARKYIAEQAKLGKRITTAEAVAHINSTL